MTKILTQTVKLLGTSLQLIAGSKVDATPATNQPAREDGKEQFFICPLADEGSTGEYRQWPDGEYRYHEDSILVTEDELLDPEEVVARFIFVISAGGYWGRAELKGDQSLLEALKEARATTQKGDKIARAETCFLHLVTVKAKHLCGPSTIEDAARSGVQLEGYEPGDVIPPFGSSYGGLIAFGENVDLGLLKS